MRISSLHALTTVTECQLDIFFRFQFDKCTMIDVRDFGKVNVQDFTTCEANAECYVRTSG